ncbi:MAG: response regulator [Deltaproteobacteria bacterium]|nr:MAG: response regulator [Deltaproteobacteria bacterium]
MRSILIIDDESDLCHSLARIVQRKIPSFSVRNTSEPNEALEWLEEEAPALIITDIRMPEISGLDLVARAIRLWGNLPIIITTAFASPELARVLDLQAFHYLPKPFRSQELLLRIQQILGLSSPQHPESMEPASPSSLVMDMIQLHALTCSTGALRMIRPREIGEIFFSKGRIVHAEVGVLEGVPAYEILSSWSDCQFVFMHSRTSIETIRIPTALLVKRSLRGGSFESVSQLDLPDLGSSTVYATPPYGKQSLGLPFSPPTPPPPWMDSSSPEVPSNTKYQAKIPSHDELQSGQVVNNVDACLQRLRGMSGLIAAYIIDLETNRPIASVGELSSRWDVSIPEQSQFLCNKYKLLRSLGVNEQIEETVISSNETYQVFRPSSRYPGIVFFIILECDNANLTLARLLLTEVELQLVLAKKVDS